MKIISALLLLVAATFVYGQQPPVLLTGKDLKGGGFDGAVTSFFDQDEVNVIYAASNGSKAVVEAVFQLQELPQEPVLKINGRYHDGNLPDCAIQIAVNDKILFSGNSGFKNDAWSVRAYTIPKDVLQKGTNRIRIQNIVAEGAVNTPPWFMLSRVGVGEKNFELAAAPDIYSNFYVTLPKEKKALPPLSKNGFKLRGTKGWNWTPEQTLEEIPYLKQFNMNFFMNCYTSMFDYPNSNEWWKPFSEDFKKKYETIVQACKQNDIEFCFALNPNLFSARHFDYNSKKDQEDLWQHYKWMAGLGVNWFSVCLDDISKGLDAGGQARMVNTLLKRLRKINPKAQMLFCPTIYASSYDVKGINDNAAYLRTLAKELDKDVYCFWTGDFVCGPITEAKAKEFKSLIGHRLIIWDNFPVNDGSQSMHLGPVTLRDKGLAQLCDGYMSNPMRTQSQLNRIPLYTIADYTLDPEQYDPEASIGQAILHLSSTPAQAQTLKNVVDIYYGFLLSKAVHNCGFNTARSTFQDLLRMKHSFMPVSAFIQHLKKIREDLAANFPGKYTAEIKTIDTDIQWMEQKVQSKYPLYTQAQP
ncbi:MAG: beta-N-acetylglucosaminidase domain-containing protein [Agriterribacter sp.]